MHLHRGSAADTGLTCTGTTASAANSSRSAPPPANLAGRGTPNLVPHVYMGIGNDLMTAETTTTHRTARRHVGQAPARGLLQRTIAVACGIYRATVRGSRLEPRSNDAPTEIKSRAARSPCPHAPPHPTLRCHPPVRQHPGDPVFLSRPGLLDPPDALSCDGPRFAARRGMTGL